MTLLRVLQGGHEQTTQEDGRREEGRESTAVCPCSPPSPHLQLQLSFLDAADEVRVTNVTEKHARTLDCNRQARRKEKRHLKELLVEMSQ